MENNTVNLYDELTELFAVYGHSWYDVKAITCHDRKGITFRIGIQNFIDCAKKHNYHPDEWGTADIPTTLRIYFSDVIFYISEYDGSTQWCAMMKEPPDASTLRKIKLLTPIDYRDEPQYNDNEYCSDTLECSETRKFSETKECSETVECSKILSYVESI